MDVRNLDVKRPNRLTPPPVRWVAALLAASLGFATPPAGAANPAPSNRAPAPPTLEQALGREMESARKSVRGLGVHVFDLSARVPAFAFDADSPRILASNTKLLTTAAALGTLGADFVFETRVLGRGELAGGTLAGDLAVMGGGDPNISGRFHDGDSYAVFRAWAHALGARGIQRVQGDLLLVNGAKLPQPAMWSYYQWIRGRVEANTPWDEFVRQLVTARGSTLDNGAANYFVLHDDPTLMAETTTATSWPASTSRFTCRAA